ncbi:MAG TPA: adenine phosphoribosyltransferase, partial [Clostridia bacterium]|nr:adenine phosphoribosyltransferase [Clostridia bacterium]
MDLRSTVRSLPDFPKKGILFRDVTTLIKNPEAYRQLIDELADSVRDKKADLVVGPEARGFVIGSA